MTSALNYQTLREYGCKGMVLLQGSIPTPAKFEPVRVGTYRRYPSTTLLHRAAR
jgi:hypothetical protein